MHICRMKYIYCFAEVGRNALCCHSPGLCWPLNWGKDDGTVSSCQTEENRADGEITRSRQQSLHRVDVLKL